MFDVTEQHETAERGRRVGGTLPHARRADPGRSCTARRSVGDDIQVVYINSRVEAVLGITPAEWIARLRRLDGGDPSRRPRAGRRGEPPHRGDRRAVRDRVPDGRARRAHRVVPRRGGARCATETGAPALLAGRDDRHHGRARRPKPALAEAEARYRALVEQLPAIAYIDPDRPARHRLHQPADRGDPRVRPGRSGTRTPICGARSCIPRIATRLEAARSATRTPPPTG